LPQHNDILTICLSGRRAMGKYAYPPYRNWLRVVDRSGYCPRSLDHPNTLSEKALIRGLGIISISSHRPNRNQTLNLTIMTAHDSEDNGRGSIVAIPQAYLAYSVMD
jgi:hypothetical protein